MTKIYILNAQSFMINRTKNIVLLNILENSFKEGRINEKKPEKMARMMLHLID